MKAKSTFAIAAACCLVSTVLVAGTGLIRTDASTITAEPVSGKARKAVEHSKAKARAKQVSAALQAEQAVRLRHQVEAMEKAKTKKQDQAKAKRVARNAANARANALVKASVRSRKERATRDAERERIEKERKKLEGTPREVARNLLADHGWDDDQFGCLDRLWTKESRWKVTADNPTSSAYGIPQALPGRRMAEYGDDWRTNPVTQIKWGLDYISDAYGSPCEAWAHSKLKNWY